MSVTWDNRIGDYVEGPPEPHDFTPVPQIEVFTDGAFYRARVHLPGKVYSFPYLFANTRLGALRHATRWCKKQGHKEWETWKPGSIRMG